MLTVLGLSVLLIFFWQSNKDKSIQFSQFIKEKNAERKDDLSKVEKNDITDFLYINTASDHTFTQEEVTTLLETRDPNQEPLSEEMMLNDVDILFRLLKNVYGGYALYGGDVAFDKARTSIEAQIHGSETLSADAFKAILRQSLTFISDGHFAIQYSPVNMAFIKQYYCNQKIEFFIDTNGYYFYKNHEKSYVLSVNGDQELDQYFKRSINLKGELTYYLGILLNHDKSTEIVTVEYKNKSKTEKDYIALNLASPIRYGADSAFEYQVIDEIPVLTLRKLHDQNDENTLRAFVETASTLKDQSQIIIDLRGNTGGTDIFTTLWLEEYTGVSTTANVNSAKKYSQLYLEGQKLENDVQIDPFLKKYDMPKLNKVIEEYYSEREEILNVEDYNQWFKEEYNPKWIENPNTIFVLIDKRVGSSAENFVSQFKTIKNVIFVGANTSGTHDINDQQNYYLPNSSLNVYMGVGITQNITGSPFIDGKGFEPDLWLCNDDLLERVIKLCKKNKS